MMAVGFFRGAGRGAGRPEDPTSARNAASRRVQGAIDLIRDLLKGVEGFILSTPDLDAPAFLRRVRRVSEQLSPASEAEEVDCHRMWAAESLAAYGQAQRSYLTEREEELWQLLNLYQEQQKVDGQANQQFNEAMRATHDRLGSVMRLSDLRQMRERLQSELTRAEHLIEEKHKADQTRSVDLASRIHHLETALVHARREAARDPLTGVLNRGALNQELVALLECPTPCVLALIDVDNFKQVNDTEGHIVGDGVLLNVVDSLTRVCRPGETLARYGGDEFCLITPDVPPDRLRDRLENVATPRVVSLRLEDRVVQVQIGLSIGIALAKPDDSPQNLVERADAALYEVKRSGKGHVRVHPNSQA